MFTQSSITLNILTYNATHKLVQRNILGDFNRKIVEHLGSVIQLLTRNKLKYANREEDPGEMDIWTENRDKEKNQQKEGRQMVRKSERK